MIVLSRSKNAAGRPAERSSPGPVPDGPADGMSYPSSGCAEAPDTEVSICTHSGQAPYDAAQIRRLATQTVGVPPPNGPHAPPARAPGSPRFQRCPPVAGVGLGLSPPGPDLEPLAIPTVRGSPMFWLSWLSWLSW